MWIHVRTYYCSQWVTVRVARFFSISVCIRCDHRVSAASRPSRRWSSHIDWRRTRWSRTQRRDWRTANPGGSLTTSWSCTAPRSSPLLFVLSASFSLSSLKCFRAESHANCFRVPPSDQPTDQTERTAEGALGHGQPHRHVRPQHQHTAGIWPRYCQNKSSRETAATCPTLWVLIILWWGTTY